eukprot:TRINITY_DN39956_c0_g1_i1.p1 TRINITY_DN39956_c0_g1~~TRINITY_DN39956_c0_g1_i1.p1  ORF type:complete len:194 (+),score=32.44 TRINITY_DN39956_c0_g1_i1:274-855(+)
MTRGPIPDCILVLCGSQYPGNLGSSMRACALQGITWICVLGGVKSDFIKAAFRAAQLDRPEAASWEVRLTHAPAELAPAVALSRLRDEWGFELVGLTDAAGAVPVWEAELSRPGLALVFGKESGGIPPEAELVLNATVTVPQVTEGCLNVSHAVAITAYERRRQAQTRRQVQISQEQPPAKRYCVEQLPLGGA